MKYLKIILTTVLLLITLLVFSQYREVDWKTNVENVVVVGIDTFTVDVDPIDYNDPGAISRVIGTNLIDYVGNRYSIISSTATTVTLVSERAGDNVAPPDRANIQSLQVRREWGCTIYWWGGHDTYGRERKMEKNCSG